MAEGVGAGFVPAQAGVFQAAGDDTVAGGFDSAAADLPAVSDVGRVVHTVQIVAHVPGQLAMRLEHLRRGRGQIERLQLSQQYGTARVFHQVAPSCTFGHLSVLNRESEQVLEQLADFLGEGGAVAGGDNSFSMH